MIESILKINPNKMELEYSTFYRKYLVDLIVNKGISNSRFEADYLLSNKNPLILELLPDCNEDNSIPTEKTINEIIEKLIEYANSELPVQPNKKNIRASLNSLYKNYNKNKFNLGNFLIKKLQFFAKSDEDYKFIGILKVLINTKMAS